MKVINAFQCCHSPCTFIHRSLSSFWEENLPQNLAFFLTELSIIVALYENQVFFEPEGIAEFRLALWDNVIQLVTYEERLAYVANTLRHRKISNFYSAILPLDQIKGASMNSHLTGEMFELPKCLSAISYVSLRAQKFGWPDTLRENYENYWPQSPDDYFYNKKPMSNADRFVLSWLKSDEGFINLSHLLDQPQLTSPGFSVPKPNVKAGVPPFRGICASKLGSLKEKNTMFGCTVLFSLPSPSQWAENLLKMKTIIEDDSGRWFHNKSDLKNAFRKLLNDPSTFHLHQVSAFDKKTTSIASEMGDGESVLRMMLLGWSTSLRFTEKFAFGKATFESVRTPIIFPEKPQILLCDSAILTYYDDFKTIFGLLDVNDLPNAKIIAEGFKEEAVNHGMIIESSKSAVDFAMEESEFLGCSFCLKNDSFSISPKRIDKMCNLLLSLWTDPLDGKYIYSLATRMHGNCVSLTSSSVYKSSALLNGWRNLIKRPVDKITAVQKIKLTVDALKIMFLFRRQPLSYLSIKSFKELEFYIVTDASTEKGYGGFIWSESQKLVIDFQAAVPRYFKHVKQSNVHEFWAMSIGIKIALHYFENSRRLTESSGGNRIVLRVFSDNKVGVLSMNKQNSRSPYIGAMANALFESLRTRGVVPKAFYSPGLTLERADNLSRFKTSATLKSDLVQVFERDFIKEIHQSDIFILGAIGGSFTNSLFRDYDPPAEQIAKSTMWTQTANFIQALESSVGRRNISPDISFTDIWEKLQRVDKIQNAKLTNIAFEAIEFEFIKSAIGRIFGFNTGKTVFDEIEQSSTESSQTFSSSGCSSMGSGRDQNPDRQFLLRRPSSEHQSSSDSSIRVRPPSGQLKSIKIESSENVVNVANVTSPSTVENRSQQVDSFRIYEQPNFEGLHFTNFQGQTEQFQLQNSFSGNELLEEGTQTMVLPHPSGHSGGFCLPTMWNSGPDSSAARRMDQPADVSTVLFDPRLVEANLGPQFGYYQFEY